MFSVKIPRVHHATALRWTVKWHGGKEYRGLRTKRYTYVRDREGPWLLYDNDADPYQLRNLADDPEHLNLRDELEKRLQKKLDQQRDEFLPGMDYINKWGYCVDENGTVPYTL